MSPKTKKVVLILILITFSSLLFIAISLFSYQKVYAGKIYRNVYFGDLDLSGKTKKQAEYIIKSKFDDLLQREVVFSANNKEISAALSDTGILFDYQTLADECYKVGRSNTFIGNIISSTKTIYRKVPVNVTPKIDEEEYNHFLEIVIAQLNSEPRNASLAIIDGVVTLAESIDGQTVVTEDLIEQIISISDKENPVIQLETASQPAATTGANFSTAKTQAENYLSQKISFSYNGKTYTPTKSQVAAWIVFQDQSGQYTATLDQSNIKAYLATVAKDFEIIMQEKKINGSTGEVIDGGREGVYLNKDEAVISLMSQISKGSASVALATTTIPAKETKIFPNEGLALGRFEGKYLDIDLAHQQLCRVDGSALVDCFTISSGKSSMPTPTGTYAIQNKNTRQWSATYGLWMPYWQAFNGSYGIHELPEWPNGYKEGESHLGTPVSHGCVRLGIGAAETIFGWTEVGTPVYIHK